jgi:hypothetical protein
MRPAQLILLSVLALAVTACGSISAPSPSVSPQPAPSASSAPAPASSAPAASSPPASAGQLLQMGVSGPAVTQLQHRLAALEYYPGTVDGRFGSDTLEAVWAFQEVQGLPVQDSVTPAMQRALASPRLPAVLVPGGGSLRVEVNLADEVLVLYRDNQVALISHVSSGGGYYFCSPGGGCGYAVTPAGDFTTTAFMPGWVTVPLGEMYNPMFNDDK